MSEKWPSKEVCLSSWWCFTGYPTVVQLATAKQHDNIENTQRQECVTVEIAEEELPHG